MPGPRHFVKPGDIVSTAFPAYQRMAASAFSFFYDPWQVDLARALLARRADRKWAARTALISIPRQAGKTAVVATIVFADSLLNPGTTTVWTAHHFKVAREAFTYMQNLANLPGVAPHIKDILTAGGNEQILFSNGSRILFAARKGGSIRGFSKVDRLVLDEAQELQEYVLADMAPTMNQSTNPQTILMCTPPAPRHHGEVVTSMRERALAGKAKRFLYVEYSASQGADLDDLVELAEANPSYPLRTDQEAVDTLRELLTDEGDYRREALGIWDSGYSTRLYPRTMWDATEDTASMPVDRLCLGVEVAPDLARASVVLAGQRMDGDWHVELDEAGDGASWVVPHVKHLLEENPQIRAVVVDAGSPAKALLDDFKREGVRVTSPKVAEIGTACTQLLNGIVTRSVHHIGQHQLTVASQSATKRKLADSGLWTHDRTGATSDITPIQAAALALHGAQADKAKKPLRSGTGRSSTGRSSRGRAMTSF